MLNIPHKRLLTCPVVARTCRGALFFIMKNIFIKIRVWFIARKIRKMYFKIILATVKAGETTYSECRADEALWAFIHNYYNGPMREELSRLIPLGKSEERKN